MRRPGALVLGGLAAVVSFALTYSPYLGPFARRGTGPLPELLPIVLPQVVAGGLLAAGSLGLPQSVRAARTGVIGQYLSIASFAVVAVSPLPLWLAIGTPTLGPMFALVAVGYLGLVGVLLGTGLLAKRLTAMGVVSRPEGLIVALLGPLGLAGYWLLGRGLAATLPPPIFGPTLVLGPIGVAWIVLGYRLSDGPNTGEP